MRKTEKLHYSLLPLLLKKWNINDLQNNIDELEAIIKSIDSFTLSDTKRANIKLEIESYKQGLIIYEGLLDLRNMMYGYIDTRDRLYTILNNVPNFNDSDTVIEGKINIFNTDVSSCTGKIYVISERKSETNPNKKQQYALEFISLNALENYKTACKNIALCSNALKDIIYQNDWIDAMSNENYKLGMSLNKGSLLYLANNTKKYEQYDRDDRHKKEMYADNSTLNIIGDNIAFETSQYGDNGMHISQQKAVKQAFLIIKNTLKYMIVNKDDSQCLNLVECLFRNIGKTFHIAAINYTIYNNFINNDDEYSRDIIYKKSYNVEYRNMVDKMIQVHNNTFINDYPDNEPLNKLYVGKNYGVYADNVNWKKGISKDAKIFATNAKSLKDILHKQILRSE